MIRVTVNTSKQRCDEKIDYRSEATARKAVEKQAAKGRVRYVYQCRHCNGWHLTKLSPAEYTERKRRMTICLPFLASFVAALTWTMDRLSKR